MKRIKVKKKLGKTKPKDNKLLSYGFVILSIILIFFMFLILFKDKSYVYEIEERKEQLEESKKSDTEDYETIGWVRVQGTNIDHPIIKVLDVNYGHPVNEKRYSWLMNQSTEFRNRIDISGHNIMNLSVNPVKGDKNFFYFEDLKNFVYEDFVKENQFIQLYIDGKDYLYQVFSVNIIPTYYINQYVSEYKDSEIKEFLNYIKEETFYDFDIEVDENDNIISLHTCTRFYGVNGYYNFVVTGKLVDENKDYHLVKFKTTKKYEEILKIMNGGDVDE